MISAYLRLCKETDITCFDIPSDQYLTGSQKSVLLDAVGPVEVESTKLGKVYRLSPDQLLEVTRNECMENQIKVFMVNTELELNVSSAIELASQHNSKLDNQSGAALSESDLSKEAQDLGQSDRFQILKEIISQCRIG